MENNKQILRLVLHNCSSDKSMMVMLHLSVSTLNTMYISTQQESCKQPSTSKRKPLDIWHGSCILLSSLEMLYSLFKILTPVCYLGSTFISKNPYAHSFLGLGSKLCYYDPRCTFLCINPTVHAGATGPSGVTLVLSPELHHPEIPCRHLNSLFNIYQICWTSLQGSKSYFKVTKATFRRQYSQLHTIATPFRE